MPTISTLRSARRWLVVALALLAAGSTGCQTFGKIKDKTSRRMASLVSSSYHDPEAEAKMAKAEQHFAAKEYGDAKSIFGDLAENKQNPVLLAEKARFLEAECLREQNKLPDAVATYNRLLQDHPAGPHREQSCTRMYEIAYGWLETDTLADIEAEQAGTKAPWWQRGSKLMPNAFDKTRPMFDTEGEAVKALENVHTHDLMGPNADKALFWSGYIHFIRGRFEDADHYFSQLVEMHKDSKLRPVALEMAIQAKNNSTGGAVYDSQKASEALQLVHHAEATEPGYGSEEKKAAWLTRQKLAVRMQLAEKDYKTAEYYERINHPGSAYFYYELVCRRYPGTKFSDLAKDRLGKLDGVRQQLETEKAAGKGKSSPFGAVEREWDKLLGKPALPDEEDATPLASGPKDQPKNVPIITR